jgi:tetratricopeptide (TPR) repeat protein
MGTPLDDGTHGPSSDGLLAQIAQARQSADLALAAQLAQRALAEGHVSPELYSLRAFARKSSGQLDDALDDLQRAHTLTPGDPGILTELADVLNGLGRHRLAITAAGDALRFDAVRSGAWFQKAFAHQMLGELDQARDSYLQAVHLQPDIAEAHARLASLAAAQGRNGEARMFADRALALRPGDAMAIMAHVRADLAEGRLAQAEPRLLAMLSEPGLPPTLRSALFSHLGDLRDAQGRIDDAFAAYSEAGTIWHSFLEEHVRRTGRETAIRQIVRVTAEIEALSTGGWKRSDALTRASADRSAGLVFILGFPRSGTTLLGQILASQPGVVVLEERPLLAKAVANFLDPPGGIARLATLSDREIETYREDFWVRTQRYGVDLSHKLVLEQTAFNTAYLPAILRLFPEAKVVFAVRDPRDVVLSCFRRQFAFNLFTMELHALQSSAELYDATMRLAEVCRARIGLHTFDIRNEDVIADFDNETRRLCDFVGVPWDEKLRDYHRASADRILMTASAAQVRRGLSRDGVGYWRRYRDHLRPVLPALAPWVERFGYSPD